MVEFFYACLILAGTFISSLYLIELIMYFERMMKDSEEYIWFFYGSCAAIFTALMLVILIIGIILAFHIAELYVLYVPIFVFLGYFIYGGYQAYVKHKEEKRVQEASEFDGT